MEHLQKKKLWGKGIVCILFWLFFAAAPLCAQAAEEDLETAIYGLDSKAQEVLSIPGNLPQSYQIPTGSNAEYSVASGKSVKVSADGLVTPKYTYWKKYSGSSSTVPEGQEYDYYTLNEGDARIAVKTQEGTTYVTVHVKDYAVAYCDEVMDAYINENITASMTDREIMDAIARFPARYDYSASYSSAYSMILYGGGDCWASTGAITTLCEKMGIKAWARNGNKDPGAGSGHMNAMAELNGIYYELEAGFSMEKGEDGYRPYSVAVRESLFSYYVSSGSVTIYQYDGYDSTGTLEVPETIDGRTVTGIAEGTFRRAQFSEIRLPDTLAVIGDFAFSACGNLTSMELPASLASIGKGAFASCEKLTLSLADGNENYQIQDQAIYSKDGTTLAACPVSGNITIPSTVTRIADYAFYYNENLTSIVIPQSVAELGEGAFGHCTQLSKVAFEGDGITSIGNFCFKDNSSLFVLRIPASVKAIGARAFDSCRSLKYIYFLGDAPEFGATVEGAFYDQVFEGCSVNAYYINGSAAWTQENLTDHGGTVVWSFWDGLQGKNIEQGVLTLEKDSYTFEGSEIKPAVTLTVDGQVLEENKDYAVNYLHNINAGTATVTAVGIGSYYGDVQASFTIAKAEGSVRVYMNSDKIMEKDDTKVRYYGNAFGTCTYQSDNPSVATVDSEGNVKGVSAGTAHIILEFPESANYLAVTGKAQITVTHDVSGQVVDDTVVDGCIQMKCGRCSQICKMTVPTRYEIYWVKGDEIYFNPGSRYKVGDVLECECYDSSDADLEEMEVISQDASVIRITENRYLNFIADGVGRVTVQPKYHPAIGKTFTFYVGNAADEAGDNKEDGKQEDGKEDGKQEDGKEDGKQEDGKGDGKQEGGKEDGKQEDNKQENEGQANASRKYYDKKTGITISVNGNGKKEAVLVKVDSKHAKGTVKVPDTLKAKGKTYKLTAIGKNAFKNQKQLKKVVIGKNIKRIDEGAFYGCERLQSVTGGKNITAIGNKAFYKCKKLLKITIPSKVNKIGKSAFYGCKSLKSITVQSKKLTKKNVGSKAFQGIHPKAVIKVPKSRLSAYKKLLKSKGVGAKARWKK